MKLAQETLTEPARLTREIIDRRNRVPANRALLAGISGIDASGKGFVAARLADRLRRRGFNAANINVDSWLNLPAVRFDERDPAGNFYRRAIRFEEMFERLVLPLREQRSIRLTADLTEETAAVYKKREYVYHDIDIILLEGIFLFKKEFSPYFDLKIWIECPFETALSRAVARGQENLSPAETVRAYETVYFPAQRIHFSEDAPRLAADLIFPNP